MQHEIGIILRVKNLNDVKKQLNGVFGKTIPPAAGKAAKATKKLNTKLGQTSETSRKAAGGVKEFASRLFSSLAVLRLFQNALGGTVRLFEEGAGLERTSNAFETAVGGIAKVLPVLRSSTRGTVEDMKLLQTATSAVTEGLSKDKLPKAFQIATAAARRMGKTVPEAMDLVTKALVRNDEASIRGLGIQVDKNKNYQALLSILGRLPGPANRLARIQATESFIMGELNKKYGDFTKVQADSLESLERARATFQNFRRVMGQFVIMGLEPVVKAFTFLIDKTTQFFTGMRDNFPVLTKTVITLGTLATGAIAAGAAFKALKFIVSTLGLKKMLLTPLMALGPKGWIIAGVITGVTYLGNKFGWFNSIGDKFGQTFKFIGAAVRTFISIISTYDSETGIGKSLKSDQEILGGTFKYIQRLARGFVVLREFATGAFDRIVEKLEPVRNLFDGIYSIVVKVIAAVKSLASSLIDSTIGKALGFVEDSTKGLDQPISSGALGVAKSLGAGVVNKASDWVSGLFSDSQQPEQSQERLMDRFQGVPLSDETMNVVEEKQKQDEMLKTQRAMVDRLDDMLGLQKDQARKQDTNFVLRRN
jgi:hypothetical protein